jgi:hypothetical protein
VDDFKMSGPKGNLARGWGLLKQGLILEKPKDVDGESYLGCRSRRKTVTLPSGTVAVINEYDMVEFFNFNLLFRLYRTLHSVFFAF